MAACYKQAQETKKEIEFNSKVIERASQISDTNLLVKAYLRRGYAYETLEKLNAAKKDLEKVREL